MSIDSGVRSASFVFGCSLLVLVRCCVVLLFLVVQLSGMVRCVIALFVG